MKRLLCSLLAACALLAGLQAAALADTTAPADRPALASFKGKTLENERVKSRDYLGKVLVINFWATWCGPCKQELPFLEQYYQQLKDQGLVVIAVATDGPETASKIPAVARTLRLSMPVIHDQDGSIVAALNPRGNNPFTVYVDHKGRVVKAVEGFAPGDEVGQLELLKALLAEAKADQDKTNP
jgi:thiol-disulfide isomerase/thioredoxin